MTHRVLCGALVLAAQASAQTFLYGVRANGDLIRIDRATGAGVLVGNSGVQADAAGSYVYDGGRANVYIEYILTAAVGGPHLDEIQGVNRFTGLAAPFRTFTGRPAGYGVRAMTAIPLWSSAMYALLQPENPTASSLVATVDIFSGALTVLGPTGRTDLTSIAASPWGIPYALGTEGGGTLYTIPASGEAIQVGGGSFGGDCLALEFMPDGTLLACGANLRSVDPATGATTLIGPTGFTDIRDLTWIKVCYANCDTGGPPPMLNVQDFGCFLNRFANGDPWANCDLSTTPPALNVADFMCFINAMASAAGCQ